MGISSISFLFFFLPLALILYYFANDRFKEYVLFSLSLLFYSLATLRYFSLFFAATMTTVILGRTIAKNRKDSLVRSVLLIIGIGINLGLLAYYKYHNVAFSAFQKINIHLIESKDILLPVGISFFTFKAISYLIDKYRGRIILSGPLIHDALYLSFFGQLQSGPLSRYNDMHVIESSEERRNLFTDGIWRFAVGFCKKILIANVLNNIVAEVYGTDFADLSTAFAWLGSICYSLQLYYDFSGYSDMAIGISQMFGYHCPENFDYPYMTESISQFWRRWHITLGAWFRDYVYIPMGGSRCSPVRNAFNLLVVWVLTGFWHGASLNFIVWGVGHFGLILFEKMLNVPGRFKKKYSKTVYRLFSVVAINTLWVLFRAENLHKGIRFIGRMFVFHRVALSDVRAGILLSEYFPFIVFATILSIPIGKMLDDKLKYHSAMISCLHAICRVSIIILFIWAISYVVAGQNNPFTYANF